MYPPQLLKLIEALKTLPSVGEKTATRYALHLCELDENTNQMLAHQIITTRQSIKRCQRCYNYCQDDLCTICLDPNRQKDVICVVSSVKDLVALEKIKQYQGQYFVLNQLISPLHNVLPQDLNLTLLQQRLSQEPIKEVILALDQNIEGETTSLYISKVLASNVLVTQLAQGLPMGVNLEYSDPITLSHSLVHRKKR